MRRAFIKVWHLDVTLLMIGQMSSMLVALVRSSPRICNMKEVVFIKPRIESEINAPK